MLWFKRKRRARLWNQPFPETWRAVLGRNVPYYLRLPTADREELHGHVHILLAEKNFEGCGGLDMTDEIRVTIAAQAAVLLLHRETDYYPDLYSVLVYPSSFIARDIEPLHGDFYVEGDDERVGESSHRGAVVLAWDEVVIGGAHYTDGYNVVYHEFAHQLDLENGEMDGVPRLPNAAAVAVWTDVMGKAYDRLVRDIEMDRPSVLDDYAADDPVEFFAVATECFFEKPLRLRKNQPAVYEQLRAYYGQDPATLFSTRPAT